MYLWLIVCINAEFNVNFQLKYEMHVVGNSRHQIGEYNTQVRWQQIQRGEQLMKSHNENTYEQGVSILARSMAMKT